MKCDDVRDLMSERVDGCLDAAGGARLEEHLAGCPACRREMADLEKAVAAVRGLPAVNAPHNLAERVRIRLPRRGWTFTEIVNLPQTRLAFAAGLIVIVTVWGLRLSTPVGKDASDAVQPAASLRAPAATPAPDLESGLDASRMQTPEPPALARGGNAAEENRSRRRADEAVTLGKGLAAAGEEGRGRKADRSAPGEAEAEGRMGVAAKKASLPRPVVAKQPARPAEEGGWSEGLVTKSGSRNEVESLTDQKAAPAPAVAAKPAAPATEQLLHKELAEAPRATQAMPADDLHRQVAAAAPPPAKGGGGRGARQDMLQEPAPAMTADKAQEEMRGAEKSGQIWQGKAANAKAGLDYAPKDGGAARESNAKLAFADAPVEGQKREAVADETKVADTRVRSDRDAFTLGGTAAPAAAPAPQAEAKDGWAAGRTTNSVTIRVRDFAAAVAQIRQASSRVIDPGVVAKRSEYKSKSRAPTTDVASISGTYTQIVLIADIGAAEYNDLLTRLTAEGEVPASMSPNLNVSGRMAQVAVQNAALEQQAASGERYLVRFTLLPFRAPVVEK